MTVATPVQPDATTQLGSTYKANLDAANAVAARFATWFAPHENDAGSPAEPDMTVRLEAGFVWDGATATDVAAQSTATITAPSGNPRIDLVVVDAETGAVSVVTGSESASPSAPAVPAGKMPVAQVALTVSQTTIENTDITDVRVLPLPAPVGQSEAEAGSATTPRLWTAQRVGQAIAAQANSNDDSVRLGHAVLAEQVGTVVELFDGVADAFGDTSGVDAASSTNEYRLSGFYQGLTGSGGNSLQDSKGGNNSTTLSAANPHAGVRWTQSGDAIVLGLRLDVDTVVTPGNVTGALLVFNNSTPIATSGTVAVSSTGEVDFLFSTPVTLSDGTSYVIDFTRASGEYNISTVSAPGTDVTFSAVASTDLFNMAADNNMDGGEDLRLGVILGTPAALTLTGETYTASAVPSAGTALVFVQENEAVTANTDFFVDMTRNGGSTWEEGTLSLIKTLSTGVKVYKAAGIDLTGMSSGTSVAHRVRTASGKDIEFHAIVSDVA